MVKSGSEIAEEWAGECDRDEKPGGMTLDRLAEMIDAALAEARAEAIRFIAEGE